MNRPQTTIPATSISDELEIISERNNQRANDLLSFRRWTSRMIIFLTFLIILLISSFLASAYLLYLKFNILTNMDIKLNEAELKIHSLESTLNELQAHVSFQEDIINRLNNRTTNADVLDQLETYKQLVTSTETYLEGLVQNSSSTVKSLLAENQNNVQLTVNNATSTMSSVLENTHIKFNATLQETTLNLRHNVDVALLQVADTSEQMKLQMLATHRAINSTLQDMHMTVTNEVQYALADVHDIQLNVTNQLGLLSSYVNTTVAVINQVMNDATQTIHDEVETVRESVEEYVSITNEQFAKENDFVKYQLAGTFTLLGCLISLWHLTSHQRHLNKPDIQRRVMAVLWMVPIYSITSWLTLVFPKTEYVLSAIRDCYEAYAVYTFIALLIAIIEDGKGLSGLLNVITWHVVHEREAVSTAREKGLPIPKEHIKPPFACCTNTTRPEKVAALWLYQCKLMAMQFVIFKPLLSAIPFICQQAGYNFDATPVIINNQINWACPKIYLAICKNLSVASAFYGLLSFYHGTEKDLAWCNPWPKFLCIKGVVFATFWQGAGIQFMCEMGVINERAAMQIQCLLICIEMLLASIAHFYIFPYNEWQEDYKREREKGILLRDTLALRDFVTDMRQMVTTWEHHTPDLSNLQQNNSQNSLSTTPAHSSMHNLRNSQINNAINNGSPSSPLLTKAMLEEYDEAIAFELNSAMNVASLSLSALSETSGVDNSSNTSATMMLHPPIIYHKLPCTSNNLILNNNNSSQPQQLKYYNIESMSLTNVNYDAEIGEVKQPTEHTPLLSVVPRQQKQYTTVYQPNTYNNTSASLGLSGNVPNTYNSYSTTTQNKINNNDINYATTKRSHSNNSRESTSYPSTTTATATARRDSNSRVSPPLDSSILPLTSSSSATENIIDTSATLR